MESYLIIMGIDPGIAICGYGIISKNAGREKLIEYGSIRTNSDTETSKRLEMIYKNTLGLIRKHKPDVVIVEELFINKNTKTALKVGQAKGVAILACAHAEVEVLEYTPLQVKQGICGYGKAPKKQVQDMVKKILNLSEIPKPDDASDALAAALSHSNMNMKLSRRKVD